MIKKLLASTLSAIFVASSVITGNNKYVIECDKRQSDVILSDGKNQYDLQATNSLGNYITQSVKDNNINPDIKPLSNHNSETFNITNLGFDAESGIIVATSTQTQDCMIVFSFIDEGTNKIIQEVKRNVVKGEYVLTEAKADIASLSQYYTVQAQLIEKKGKVISNTFKLDKYTKIMQEIAATDIHDFDGAQVVNFDDNDETNFLVLSDETVKAECSEEENTLVSADYDSSTFVFENINESIRYLQNGDLLYIQPDKENVIAVSVDDIDIDGDTAIVKGSDDIDDMFEFIKIETQTGNDDIEVDTTDTDEDVTYPQYNEKRFFYPSNQMLDFDINMKKAIKVDLTNDFSIAVHAKETEQSLIGKAFEEDETIEPDFSGRLTFRVSFNFFKKKGYTSAGISFTTELKLSAKVDFTPPDPAHFDVSKIGKFYQGDEYESVDAIDYFLKKYSMGHFKVPTGVFGVLIDVQPEFVVSFTGSIELSFSYAHSVGFTYNTNDSFQPIDQKDKDNCDASLKLSGEVFIGLSLKPGVSIFSDKILNLSFVITAGIVGSIEATFDARDVIDAMEQKKSESGHVVITDKEDADYYHSCALCCYGTVSLRLNYGIEANIVGSHFSKDLNPESDSSGLNIPLPFDWCEFCFGITSLKPFSSHFNYRVAYDDNPEEKVCPHRKYKVEFTITDEKQGYGLNDVEVTLDGLTQKTNYEGRAVFYCDNGSYSYQLKFGNKTQSGKFIVDNDVVPITGTFDWTLTDDDEIVVNNSSVTSYKGGNRKIVTTTTRTTKPLITETICKEEDKICESLQLGDNIWGFVYPDNTMRIYGYGDMYSDRELSIKNIKNITEVFFDDIDSDNNRYITSIGKHLFDGAENLEVVYLSNEITKIDDYAFYGCKNLKYFRYGGENDTSNTLVLPSKLKSVGFRTFRDCESAMFGDLEFGNDIEKLGCDAFWNCDEITSVNVPVSVNTIEPTVFWGCDNLKNAVIKADVSTIGPGLFYACNALEEITLPDFVSIKPDKSETYCLQYLFSNHNSSSPSIDVPDTLTRINVLNGDVIHNSTFEGFENVKTIALPQGITQIGARAFYGCKQMNIICSDEEQDLTFSELFADLESIGGEAFKGDVNILIGNLVFGEKFKLLGWDSFWDCKGITSVVIPANVTEIQVTAFWGCDNLKNAVIKADVSTIGPGLFYACNALDKH